MGGEEKQEGEKGERKGEKGKKEERIRGQGRKKKGGSYN
jgi:hypothetical protein